MERWYPTGSYSLEIDRASKGGVSGKERVNLFVREQAPHLGAYIDQFLTGAAGLFGGDMRFSNYDLLNEVVK